MEEKTQTDKTTEVGSKLSISEIYFYFVIVAEQVRGATETIGFLTRQIAEPKDPTPTQRDCDTIPKD